MDAFEQVLQSWACILREGRTCSISRNDQVKFSATRIFDTYLRCHLAPPEGTRQIVSLTCISSLFLYY